MSAATDASPGHGHGASSSLATLALGAVGVVYGDIGTSPLYTMRECLAALAGSTRHTDILDVCSLIFWAMTLVVTVKYLMFILKADNQGEGGILALLALVPSEPDNGKGKAWLGPLAMLVVVGAGLLYGDGVITPAISVLGALEGVAIQQPAAEPWIVPIACVILVALFAVQSRGTGKIGLAFGPIMVVWFLTLAVTGLVQIVQAPQILAALSPLHAADLFLRRPERASALLAAVVLAVTGGEALYADMGHFGAKPIRAAWLGLAMPSLVIAYLGQGALLLRDPSAIENPFFHMVPEGAPTYALVVLSTMAAIIASQALISGVFSLTHQAIQLGYFPRVTIRHTSRETEGQIYVPEINTMLAIGCILLVVVFRSSGNLAGAYGLAVCGTMAITSVVYFVVITRRWNWPLVRAVPLLLLFLAVDIPFLVANAAKFFHGGYVPVAIAAVLTAVMALWYRGRRLLARYYAQRTRALDEFVASMQVDEVARVPGTAVFMASNPNGLPPLLIHHVKRSGSLHRNIILLSVIYEHRPQVPEAERFTITECTGGFVRLVARQGFMEAPDVPRSLARAKELFGARIGEFDSSEVTYYLGRETFLATRAGHMGPFAETIFAFLARNSRAATAYFHLPAEQVVEIGTQIDL